MEVIGTLFIFLFVIFLALFWLFLVLVLLLFLLVFSRFIISVIIVVCGLALLTVLFLVISVDIVIVLFLQLLLLFASLVLFIFWLDCRLFLLLVIFSLFALAVLLEVTRLSWLEVVLIKCCAAILFIVTNITSFLEQSSCLFVHVDSDRSRFVNLRLLFRIALFIFSVCLAFTFFIFFRLRFLYLLRLFSFLLGSSTLFVSIGIAALFCSFWDYLFLSWFSIPCSLWFRWFWFLFDYLFILVFLLFFFVFLLLLFF